MNKMFMLECVRMPPAFAVRRAADGHGWGLIGERGEAFVPAQDAFVGDTERDGPSERVEAVGIGGNLALFECELLGEIEERMDAFDDAEEARDRVQAGEDGDDENSAGSVIGNGGAHRKYVANVSATKRRGTGAAHTFLRKSARG